MFGFAFKRIGSSSYSVYEHEKEVLFITPYVLIIKIEEVKINNPVTHTRIYNKFQNQCSCFLMKSTTLLFVLRFLVDYQH